MFTFKSNISAVVCGASQGIGKEIALQLASLNIQVLAVARSSEKLSQLKTELKDSSSLDHETISCDFSKLDQVEVLAKQIESKSYQILICNAGGPKGGPLAEANLENFEEGFRIHLLANQILVKGILPSMRNEKWGRIINIISTSVKSPIVDLGVSNTIRGAVAQWSKTLSLELGKDNITVNNVLPGYTSTDRLSALIQGASERLSKSKDEIAKEWKAKVPLNRFAKPEEVASAVTFLCSENADYISGINLPVDGGRTASL